MKKITEMTDEEICMYIYHQKGVSFSDGYGNKIFLLNPCNEDEEVVS